MIKLKCHSYDELKLAMLSENTCIKRVRLVAIGYEVGFVLRLGFYGVMMV